jgi:hypothetical protein
MTRARDLSNDEANNGGATPPFVGAKNFLFNGSFDIWQRGTTFTSIGTTQYSADRWYYGHGGTSNYTFTRQTTSDTTNLPNIQYAIRLARVAGNTNTAQQYFANVLETVKSIPLVGKTITLSYYARVGANYSGGSTFRGYAATGATVDVPLFSGVASNNVASTSPTLTTTWQRFTASGTVATSQTQACVYFTWTPSGTAGANDWIEITGVQLEIGSVATPFARAGGSIGGELALCQRYYYLHSNGATKYTSMAAAYSGTEAYGYLQFPVSMRVPPTLSATSGSNYYLFRRNNTYAYITALSQDYVTTTGSGLYVTGLTHTAGWAGWFAIENAAGSIAFSAEL